MFGDACISVLDLMFLNVFWKWIDESLHPRFSDLIHNLKKENDSLKHEKNALETDLEKFLAYDIEEKCGDKDEISVSKGEEVVSIMKRFLSTMKLLISLWRMFMMGRKN
ncbi:uncharacterized protein LOC132614065 [Lycium barbarum]|uniref:uncharacterized protein LOC132614065 n=1 Tax=Lycium barbarum TaxID=112863 RepID=UPI00293E8F0A|nr:uncharacterized protein LOC132614065 [Lycium barbarum]